jgi:hypoxanthine phosphoribosyltransferase
MRVREQATARADPVIGESFLDEETIRGRIRELGAEITADYRGQNLVLLSILKGAVFFIADLSRAIHLPLEMEYMAITSYQQDHKRGDHPTIRITKDTEQPLTDKDVVIVEDIIDTGLTLYYITRFLESRGLRSLRVCTLLDRPYRRLVEIPVKYTGFTVPDCFFVGYGFDYHQLHRNLPHLAKLNI